MATIKVKFRCSTVKDSEGTIYFQVLHKRIARQITTTYRIFPCEWNEAKGSIVNLPNNSRYELLEALKARISWDIELLNQVISTFEVKTFDYSSDDIVNEFSIRKKRGALFNFLNDTIAKLQMLGKTRTAETYAATLASFRKFRNGEDIMLHAIDSNLIEHYQAYLSANGLTLNTISFYMRILRAAYNRAVENDIVKQNHPFKHVYTGVAKTIKRAIPLKAIKAIKLLDLSDNQRLEFARDMFLLSFYTRGMSFIDIAYLKKENLRNGIISYRRKKTGQLLHVACEKSISNLIERYRASEDSPFLLSIIHSPNKDSRRQYQSRMYTINKSLKEIAALAKIDAPLTLYVARHSWASIAHSRNIPVSVISKSMGHDSEATTQIYLASLDMTAVNKANNQIIAALEKC